MKLITRPGMNKRDSTEDLAPSPGTATRSQMPRPGDCVLERYLISDELGKGGMAVVFRARDLELDEMVAIKFMNLGLLTLHNMVERFKSEIKLARRIVHSNVCRIYDIGTSGDLKFVTMELLEGCTLRKVLADESPDSERCLELFRGLLHGLDAAHQRGIMHHDLKPENIMITPGDEAVIMDFGLARDHRATEDTGEHGEMMGTPAYMAPERMMGEDSDHRSDIYSLGILLYEMLAGELPFQGKTVYELAHQQMTMPPPDASSTNPEIPGHLAALIASMLDKEPAKRPQNVGAVLEELYAERKSKSSVLIADDDPAFRDLLELELSHRGLRVSTASDGTEALQYLELSTPDLLCLDLKMPVMDGFQVAEYLHRSDKKTRLPIFMLTATTDPQYERHAARLGIERFFTKPVNFDELTTAILARLSH